MVQYKALAKRNGKWGPVGPTAHSYIRGTYAAALEDMNSAISRDTKAGWRADEYKMFCREVTDWHTEDEYAGVYDYLEAIKRDIREWIDENDFFAGRDMDYADNDLEDALWAEDSVTGNGSGSYTFSSQQAKEYVMQNTDLCREALVEFCTEPQDIADHFLNGDWEWFDVTIRCYLLSRAVSEVVEEIDRQGGTVV